MAYGAYYIKSSSKCMLLMYLHFEDKNALWLNAFHTVNCLLRKQETVICTLHLRCPLEENKQKISQDVPATRDISWKYIDSTRAVKLVRFEIVLCVYWSDF